ncbi:MAG: magnesium transporter [Candidatus Poribacteria bacterium]
MAVRLSAERARLLIAVPKRREELVDELSELYPTEIVELFEQLTERERVLVFRLLPITQATDVFEKLPPQQQISLLMNLSRRHRADILNEMSPDDRADLFDRLPDELASALLPLLEEVERLNAGALMAFPEDTAGGRMTTEYARLAEDISVSEALEELRKLASTRETIRYVYVTDKTGVLVGFLHLEDLVFAKPSQRTGDIMRKRVISVRVDTDQEEVAKVCAEFDLNVIPVVDERGKLRGIVTVDDVIDIIKEEATEDMQKMAALEAMDLSYFQTKFLTLVRKRLLWLIILLIAETLSGDILKSYSHAMEVIVGLAYFIPMLIDTGGNAGTQSATLIIRGLAMGEIGFRQIFSIVRREIASGLILGCVLGGIAFGRALWLGGGDPMLGITVGIALTATVTASTLSGALLPLIFHKLKLDPAVMCGPFITTIVDVVGLIIYFELAKVLLKL